MAYFFSCFLLLCASLLIACEKQAPSKGEAPSAAPRGALELVFPYGSEKEKWINNVTPAFNRSGVKTSSGKTILVRTGSLPLDQVLTDCLAEYQNPISPEVMAFQIQIAASEATALEFVPQIFRRKSPG